MKEVVYVIINKPKKKEKKNILQLVHVCLLYYKYISKIIVLHLQVHFGIGTQIRGSLPSTSRITYISHVHV